MTPRLIIAALLVGLSLQSQAWGSRLNLAEALFQNDPPQQVPRDSTGVATPVSEKELEGTVEVSFRINPEGKAQILNIQASNPRLIDYVVKKLNKIQLEKGSNDPGQVITYRFVFKKQA